MKFSLKAKHNPFFSNSFYIFFIRFFPSLANLAVMIYYSRVLDKPTYGAYQNYWIQFNMLYPFACFGLHFLIVTYTPAYLSGLLKRLKRFQPWLYLLWIVVVSTCFALLQNSVQLYFVVPLLFMVAFALNVVLESYLIVSKNFRSLLLINFLFAAGYCAIHWLVLKHGFSLVAIFIWLLLLNCARLLASGVIAFANNRKASPETINGKQIIDARKLWMHLGFYDVSQVVFTWIDKFIISLFFSSAISGIYYNGTMNIPFLPLIVSAASSAILIQLASTKDDSLERSIRLMNISAKLTSGIVFPLFLFLLLFREQLYTALLPAYMASVPIFLISLLILPLRAYNFTTVLQNRHKGAIINIGAILDLVLACALMYPLYLLWGLCGVALSFVISSYLQALFYLYHTARVLQTGMLRLLPMGNWLIKLVIYSLVLIGIHYIAVSYFTTWIALTLGGVVAVGIVIVSLLVELKLKNKYHVGTPQTTDN